MSATTLYGIANCDTIRKARRWLEARDIDYRFHDYRKQGLDQTLLKSLESGLGWQALLNRRGTTWRGLDASVRESIERDGALALMLENPALIKRPILDHEGSLHLGFDDRQYEKIFG